MAKTNTTTTNATVNAAQKENKNMKREIRTQAQNGSEFTVSYQRNGYGGIIPTIDGVERPDLMMGYVSESDLDAGMKLLADAIAATNGDIEKAKRYMYDACRTAALDIKADEAVDIDGIDFVIDYNAKKIYRDGYEVANLDNINAALSAEAVKELLIDKVRTALNDPYWEEDDEWDM